MNKGSSEAMDMQAAAWVVRLEDREQPATPREQGDFFAWLMCSPDHVKAFLAMADLSRVLDGMDAGRRLDIEKLFRAGSFAPTPLRADLASPRATTESFRGGSRMRNGALAAVILAAIATVIGVTLPNRDNAFHTSIGEQRTVQLPDGSVMNLNTRSRAEIHFSPQIRRVDLLEGEALFSVARDATRPFSVHTADAVIRAIGTEFNVYRHRDETIISVMDGSVQVTPDAARASGSLIKAGEQVKVENRASIKRQRLNRHHALAWRERRLIFENASLAEVIAEFNRYNPVQLQAESALATTKHLTAIFSADKPQSLVRYLEQDPALEVVESGSTVVIRSRELLRSAR